MPINVRVSLHIFVTIIQVLMCSLCDNNWMKTQTKQEGKSFELVYHLSVHNRCSTYSLIFQDTLFYAFSWGRVQSKWSETEEKTKLGKSVLVERILRRSRFLMPQFIFQTHSFNRDKILCKWSQTVFGSHTWTKLPPSMGNFAEKWKSYPLIFCTLWKIYFFLTEHDFWIFWAVLYV